MRTFLRRSFLLVSLTHGIALPAQEPSTRSLRHNAGIAVDGERVVGVGADYRAEWHGTTLRFTPAFGDATPQSVSLTLAVESVRRGAHILESTAHAAARVRGERIEFARGPELRERFDVRPEGVEHSFVFATRPGGSGDLVVRCTVAGPLVGHTLADGTVRFWRDGLGGIAIGQVTGIDANGWRIAGTLRLADGTLDYVLPAAFVDAAAYPLLLDPLIASQFVLGAADDLESDVAYDPGSDTYLAAWKRRLSTVDHDILAQRLDANGAVLGSTLLLETSSSIVASRPQVAAVRTRSAFAVVWQQGSGAFGPFDIRARSVDGLTGALSSAVTVVGTAEDEFAPCVSSEVTTVDDEVLVAWQTPTGISAMQLTLPTSLVPTPSSIVAITATQFAQRPAFSKSGGNAGQHLIVWAEESLLGDTQIRGRIVTRNLTLLTPVTAFTTSARHKANPRCDGDGQTFVVAYEREEVSTSRTDVYARRITYAAGATSFATGEIAVEATGAQIEASPDVAWLGTRWSVALQERQSGLDDDVVVWILRDDCLPCSDRTVLTGLDAIVGQVREFQPRLANRYAGLVMHDEALLLFTEAQDVPPFVAATIVQRLEAIGPGVPPVTLAPGCGGGGTAGNTGGPFHLGTTTFQFQVTGLPVNALPLLSLSFPGPAPVVCGPCIAPVPVALASAVNVGGTASSGLVVPCQSTLLGAEIDSQWLSMIGGTSGPCPLLPDFVASSLVRFTVSD